MLEQCECTQILCYDLWTPRDWAMVCGAIITVAVGLVLACCCCQCMAVGFGVWLGRRSSTPAFPRGPVGLDGALSVRADGRLLQRQELATYAAASTANARAVARFLGITEEQVAAWAEVERRAA